MSYIYIYHKINDKDKFGHISRDSDMGAKSNQKLELRNWGLRNHEGLRGAKEIKKYEPLKKRNRVIIGQGVIKQKEAYAHHNNNKYENHKKIFFYGTQ